ncbi:MAG TPA: CBS domain-containing protein [Phenylobacterium sp.]
MRVSEAMSRDVEVARPQDSLQTVARRMAEIDVGALPVCDGQELQGMITDRDIVVRAIAEGRSFETPVSEVMTGEVEFAFADDDLDEAADKMASAQIRRLPVLDKDRRLVGILSLGDLTGKVKDKTAGQTLQEISEPSSRA